MNVLDERYEDFDHSYMCVTVLDMLCAFVPQDSKQMATTTYNLMRELGDLQKAMTDLPEEIDDGLINASQPVDYKVGANEAGAAGDENHGGPC